MAKQLIPMQFALLLAHVVCARGFVNTVPLHVNRAPSHAGGYAAVGAAAAGVLRMSGGGDAGESKPRIGFLGLGIMGVPMAQNLVKAGYSVTVWNRTPDKCEAIVSLGAQQGATPAEVVAASDVTFSMLSDPAAAEAVALGADGVVAGITPGKGYVDVPTVSPECAQAIAAKIEAKGGRFLEAPVSGSKKPAEDGALIFLCAGDEGLYEEVLGPLEVMGKKHLYLGKVGAGAKMKLVVNMIMG